MSKFGEIINTESPVLISFYNDWNESSEAMHSVIRNVAAVLGDKARVIKIDIEKNNELAEALRIKTVPTLMITKKGKWFGGNQGNSMQTLLSLPFRNLLSV